MIETRRHTLDALRSGPALFADLPGDEVDLDRLAAHLARRRVDGGIYATDGSLEGLLWIRGGVPGEAWFFEAGEQEAVLPVTTSRDLLLEITSRGGLISVFIGTPPPAAAPVLEPLPQVDEGEGAEEAIAGAESPEAADISEAVRPDQEAMASWVPGEAEPSIHPWPEILAEVIVRVVRHRGPRLAAQFTDALARALEPYGGGVDGGRVVAPPLSDAAWRHIVEAGCVPVVAVAGRAFVERSLAAAERAVRDAGGQSGERP